MAFFFKPAPCAVLRRFACSRRAGAATEFALVGLWVIGLMFVIVNLALLSFSLGALAHGVQAAARQAAVTAANSSSNTPGTPATQTFNACPVASAIAGYFNNYAIAALPSAGTNAGSSNPYINANWNYASGSSLGLYVTVSGTYTWHPIGFNILNSRGITLKISTVATVPGSISLDTTKYTVSVGGPC